jgi:hypothetical protein
VVLPRLSATVAHTAALSIAGVDAALRSRDVRSAASDCQMRALADENAEHHIGLRDGLGHCECQGVGQGVAPAVLRDHLWVRRVHDICRHSEVEAEATTLRHAYRWVPTTIEVHEWHDRPALVVIR